jgi:hypothetical protein
MTDSNEYVSWRKLREFANVDLTKSFVLGWNTEAGILMIDVDIFLEPDHPFYEEPRPAEKICIRPAIIEFPLCDAIIPDHGDAQGSLSDIAASLEIGHITGLRRFSDGPYEIRGDFGTVKIDAERPVLKLRGP